MAGSELSGLSHKWYQEKDARQRKGWRWSFQQETSLRLNKFLHLPDPSHQGREHELVEEVTDTTELWPPFFPQTRDRDVR